MVAAGENSFALQGSLFLRNTSPMRERFDWGKILENEFRMRMGSGEPPNLSFCGDPWFDDVCPELGENQCTVRGLRGKRELELESGSSLHADRELLYFAWFERRNIRFYKVKNDPPCLRCYKSYAMP